MKHPTLKEQYEYRKKMHDLYLQDRKERRLRNEKHTKNIIAFFKSFLHQAGTFIKMIVCAFLSALVGISSKPIIYILNQPLGEGYALVGSYMIAGLSFFLIYYGLKDR